MCRRDGTCAICGRRRGANKKKAGEVAKFFLTLATGISTGAITSSPAYHLEMTRMPFDAHTRVVAMLCHRAGIPKFDKKCVRFIWGVLVCRAKRLLTRACLIATSGSHVGEAPLIYYNNTGSLQVRPDAQHARVRAGSFDQRPT